MGNYLICASISAPPSVGPGLTRYFACMGYLYPLSDTNSQEVVRNAFTASLMTVRVVVNTLTVTSNFYFRENGINVNQTIAVGSGLTGLFQDTTHTDVLAAGNLVQTQLVTGATGTLISTSLINYQFSISGLDVPIMGASNATAFSVANSITIWCNIFGVFQAGPAGSEGPAQYKVRVAGIWSNLRVYVTANTNTKAGQVDSRINAANGTQVVTIPASGTGQFEDTTHTDNVASGANIDVQITTGTKAGTSTSFRLGQSKWASTGQLLGNSALEYLGIVIGAGIVRYAAFGGITMGSSDENYAKGKGLFYSTYRNMYVLCMYIQTGATGNFVIALRKNGVTTALQITGSALGVYEDTTHTVDVDPADDVDTLFDNSAVTVAGYSFSYAGYQVDQRAAPSGAKNFYSGAFANRQRLSRGLGW